MREMGNLVKKIDYKCIEILAIIFGFYKLENSFQIHDVLKNIFLESKMMLMFVLYLF